MQWESEIKCRNRQGVRLHNGKHIENRQMEMKINVG